MVSSSVMGIGHDGQDLWVRFQGGALYRYKGAAAHHVEALLGHKSPGGYFQREIRGAFGGERIIP